MRSLITVEWSEDCSATMASGLAEHWARQIAGRRLVVSATHMTPAVSDRARTIALEPGREGTTEVVL